MLHWLRLCGQDCSSGGNMLPQYKIVPMEWKQAAWLDRTQLKYKKSPGSFCWWPCISKWQLLSGYTEVVSSAKQGWCKYFGIESISLKAILELLCCAAPELKKHGVWCGILSDIKSAMQVEADRTSNSLTRRLVFHCVGQYLDVRRANLKVQLRPHLGSTVTRSTDISCLRWRAMNVQ